MKQQNIIGTLLLIASAIWTSPLLAHGPWYVGPQNGFVYTGNGYVYTGGYGYDGYGYNAYGPYGFGYGNYGGAQTAYSAEAIGMANLVRAQGEYNEQTAKASVSYEQARSQYLENQQKAFSARMAGKRVAQANEAKSHQDARAFQAHAAQYVASNKPAPLSQGQLDITAGRIQWPSVLTTKDFEESRVALDTLFATRAKNGPTASFSTQVERKAGEMKDALRRHILTIPLSEYSEARRFLDSLAVSTN